MRYRRCGRSGLDLPAISLGLWQNFGHRDGSDTARALLRHAFDAGVTHFDLANNYGPPPGAAEANFGRVLKAGLGAHRDEMVISTKAGYDMWGGPYGSWGSRKHMRASLDASLSRMGLDYVDIFYHHRPDPITPLAETMGALDAAVRSGKALYVGLSNYPPALTAEAVAILRALGTPCLVHQPKYSLIERGIESGLLDVLGAEGVGCAVFSPLAQGLLTGKYLEGLPADARMSRGGTLKAERLTEEVRRQLRALDAVARGRGATLAQLALAWALRDPRVTTAIVGARTVAQLDELLQASSAEPLTREELAAIDRVLAPPTAR